MPVELKSATHVFLRPFCRFLSCHIGLIHTLLEAILMPLDPDSTIVVVVVYSKPRHLEIGQTFQWCKKRGIPVRSEREVSGYDSLCVAAVAFARTSSVK